MRPNPSTSPLILALDVSSLQAALHWVQLLGPRIGFYKVGMQLFYAEGPAIVQAIHEAGGQVFLDLKLHDIPNTVASACRSVADLGVSLLTIHLSGGPAMIEAAQAVVADTDTRLLGVTALTSLDSEQLAAVYPSGNPKPDPAEWAVQLAHLAEAAGLYGIVCSAQENSAILAAVGGRLALVNPGIRPADSPVHDQKRVLTPRAAMAAGASYLVVGRPILQAPDPLATVEAMLSEVSAYAPGVSA